jgi:hypothetical protein
MLLPAPYLLMLTRGVDKFFKFSMFTRQVRKQLVKNVESIELVKKQLDRLASGSVFLLANPKFYSYLASWRVVIRTSVLI